MSKSIVPNVSQLEQCLKQTEQDLKTCTDIYKKAFLIGELNRYTELIKIANN